MSKTNSIRISGARTHNLKEISLEVPRDRLTVITGPSGSGKSSLAVDTLYAESQRRYADSLSGHMRRYMDLLDKPDVDNIEGLAPSIFIDSRKMHTGPRSTVGTVTEVYGFLRLLYAQAGHVRSVSTGKRLVRHTPQEIVDQLVLKSKKTSGDYAKIMILAPVVKNYKGDLSSILDDYLKQGFVRARLNGTIYRLDEDLPAGSRSGTSLDIVLDRLILNTEKNNHDQNLKRLTDSIELGLKTGKGQVVIFYPDKDQELFFSDSYMDPDAQSEDLQNSDAHPEFKPADFSFNSPAGACPACDGLGYAGNDSTASDNQANRLLDGETCFACNGGRLLRSSLAVTIRAMSIADLCFLPVESLNKWCNDLLNKKDNSEDRNNISTKVFGKNRPSSEADDLSDREHAIAEKILKEILSRTSLMIKTGAGYLHLDRVMSSLSGGEAQRIRLASQIGGNMSGIMYVLDEPSSGLHPHDMEPLITMLEELRSNSNTVLTVDHTPMLMRRADFLVELGPGAGTDGGRVTFSGTPKKITTHKCITGKYLSGKRKISSEGVKQEAAAGAGPPAVSGSGTKISMRGIRCRNLKNIDIEFPSNSFTAVTGVSGSGKSTLIRDVIHPAVLSLLNRDGTGKPVFSSAGGLKMFDSTVIVDQSPIGRSPRSNAATYCGIFTPIRNLFAAASEAKIRGYGAGRFSFNNREGRCGVCGGDGQIKVDMQFLTDTYLPCESCGSTGYNRDTLRVRFKGQNISDILRMTVSEAMIFFRSFPVISGKLQAISDVGLGYLRLGQSGTTFSGGEAQRLKLAAALAKKPAGHILYLFDEPSGGLHFEDVRTVLVCLHTLVKKGNTVIVSEHNPDIIKTADWIIDLGPGGGDNGGEVVSMGILDKIQASPASITGRWLTELT